MSIKDVFPIFKWDFRRESILLGLPAEDLALLMENRVERDFKKGEVIFKEGALPAGIFFIVEGVVKKYKLNDPGKEQIFYVANSGALIGFHAVITGERYPDSAAALTESRIAFIPRKDFLKVLDQSPTFTNRLLKILSHEFSVIVNGLNLVTQRPVRQRMALQLILLREKFKIDFKPGMPVVIDINREDLAALVGTATENAIRVLSDFKKAGILETKGSKILIHDVSQLISIADH